MVARSTYQYNTAVSLAGSLARFWLPGPNTKLLSRRPDVLDSVAFDTEEINIIRFHLVHLWRRIGVRKRRLGKGESLSLGLWLLYRCIGAEGTLSPTAAARALGWAAFLESRRKHVDRDRIGTGLDLDATMVTELRTRR